MIKSVLSLVALLFLSTFTFGQEGRFKIEKPRNCPTRQVANLIAMYTKARSDNKKADLLDCLAQTRDPRAALVLGFALYEQSSLRIRFAAVEGLLEHFFKGSRMDGGSETQYRQAHDWWMLNRERLDREAREISNGPNREYSQSCQAGDEFCRQIKVRKAVKFNGRIDFQMSSKNAMLRDPENGHRGPVLSTVIKVRNASRDTLRSRVAHEWYGGIPPLTDFLVSTKRTDVGRDVRAYGPAYQVGNLGSTKPEVTWEPHQTRSFDIRLNWPGTGSVPSEPLIDPKSPGKYSIRFILFFRAGSQTSYAESGDLNLFVP